MKATSSPRIHKTLAAIFFIIFFSHNPVEGRGKAPQVVNRNSFPQDFLFGVGTSALQIEGSAHEGGRGPSVWDSIFMSEKATIKDIDKCGTMIDHYKRYSEDVKLLKKLGINSYRFSIAWSRIFPDGTLEGGINQEGIDFYNKLIDELLANGITPFVTILHFDYPLSLFTKGGFLNPSIIKHFKDYSDVLFKAYGDRVKHWTTFNELEITAIFNYMHGFDIPIPENCQITKECRDVYTLMHICLISHGESVKLYREKYQAKQGGEIGIVLSIEDYIPFSRKPEDVAATVRLRDFSTGWILDPLFNGDYPTSMKELVRDRLPKFTEEEKRLIKGSLDFIGINYYRSFFGKDEPNKFLIKGLDNYDSLAIKQVFNDEGIILGIRDNATMSFVNPQGLYNVLVFLKKTYNNPKIYITENGIASGTISQPLKDKHRMDYIATHINYVKRALDAGVNVKGFFVWSAFDTFEFHQGFSDKWGLIYIDFADNLKRVPKQSARWYRWFLTGNRNFV
ncbi:furostanol glycoside 26-O-beta-glucosidase-like [Vicia villosa]|uniref:furostanol glycoside 26-O-beta-glucosidase-like n=1 Tax=Vicia villosa TaxID=3911 RepID=UPI00273CCC60|nr:furostanol glycoside 26-O-beta-glucosidase-like [Vicia villosa]